MCEEVLGNSTGTVLGTVCGAVLRAILGQYWDSIEAALGKYSGEGQGGIVLREPAWFGVPPFECTPPCSPESAIV